MSASARPTGPGCRPAGLRDPNGAARGPMRPLTGGATIDRARGSRWAALGAPRGPGGPSPVPATPGSSALLHRLAAPVPRRAVLGPRASRAARSTTLLRSGLCGERDRSAAPRRGRAAVDARAAARAAARMRLGLCRGRPGTRLTAVLDELAAGLRGRTAGPRARRARGHVCGSARWPRRRPRTSLTRLPNRPIVEQWVHRAFAAAGHRERRRAGPGRALRRSTSTASPR